METLLALTLSGSVLALLLLALRYFILRKMPSTVYYYAWLLVLLRFLLPLPGLIPAGTAAEDPAPAAVAAASEPLPAERPAPQTDRPAGVSRQDGQTAGQTRTPASAETAGTWAAPEGTYR